MTSSEERAWEKVSDLENKIADIKANCDLAIEGRDIKIKELEKENSDLKERYNKVDIIGYDALKNLTKAKEIIKQLMYAARDCIAWYCLCDKAKQFLKEIEK